MVKMRRVEEIESFEKEKGIMKEKEGVMIREIIGFVEKKGYFMKVKKGKSFVKIGGEIENDVNGKKKNMRGKFGCKVESMEIMRQEGVKYN